MSSKLKTMRWLLFIVATIGLGAWVYHGWMMPKTDRVQYHATVLDHPRPMPVFALESTDGQHFDRQHLQGHWTFVFFGFTHCASICPVTMAELGKMYRLLAQDPDMPRPQVVMITLDPKRDPLARMQTYVQAFQPEFLGASGSVTAVQALADAMGIAYTRVMTNNTRHKKDYSIEHSGAVLLINPQAELTAFFTPPHDAKRMAQDYQKLSSQSLD